MLALLAGTSSAQDDPGLAPEADVLTPKQRINRIRDLGKRGENAVPALAGYLHDDDREIRLEAVRGLIRVGGQPSVTPLIEASRDNDAEIQASAVDGLVNVYLPGYVPRGLTGPITKGVRGAKSLVFTRNDQMIDSSVTVRRDVQDAIANVVLHGSGFPSRTKAARAAGILRCRLCVPALSGSLRARDNSVILECLVALQKIRLTGDNPSLSSAIRDLDEQVKILALETAGVLRSAVSAPEIRSLLNSGNNLKVERAALQALAAIGLPEDRALFQRYVDTRDAQLASSALEGLGRVREPEDTPILKRAFDEPDADWRLHLAAAFGLVNQGNTAASEFSPLSYLVESASNRTRAREATAYLAEVARRPEVRKNLLPMLADASRDTKLAFCNVLGQSGDSGDDAVLDQLVQDPDPNVATAAAHAKKEVRARDEAATNPDLDELKKQTP